MFRHLPIKHKLNNAVIHAINAVTLGVGIAVAVTIPVVWVLLLIRWIL